ncbi:hypothetical protein GBA63_01145 [Rubrobacter tropicus]|uniref:GH29D-like beta-sandwich domain-containing protein n=1 Tax=Rubrobacter tropicus TaxID=2653851 RepID=A0A6G8Q4G3_9ACTN|nr:chitobiase/beta-hexosaminidase C-terminal domain-containing protein [Rubrobacter tropicus]QIN81384.1 hypothetical protein GBA63_01145 [Rubrobacter tropicus]
MTARPTNILESGSKLKKLLALSATALVMGAAAASPSWAAVNNPHALTVFPDRDMVVAENYQNGIDMRIEVLRNGVVIGDTGAARTVAGAAGSGLEVNHGAEGNPGPGDCWVGATPDIQGGDVVRVTTPAGVETTTVADIAITSGPTEDANGNVVVGGRAIAPGGGQFAAGELAEEVRDLTPRWRGEPDSIDYVGATTDWQAIYEAPFSDNAVQEDGGMTEAGRKDSILTGGHSIIWANGAGNETTISELGEPGGPAAGCEETAPAAKTAMSSVSRDLINTANANENLVVSGVATADITNVNIALGGQNFAAAPANGTWEITVPASALANLPQGPSNLVASFTSNTNTAPANQSRTINKDTVAPNAATASPGGGIYNTDQSVSLGSPEGNAQIYYTTDGSEPTAATGTPYTGQQIVVTGSQTIKAIVVDAAGNSSSVASFGYTIDRVAPGLSMTPATGSYDAAQTVTLASDDPDAEIRYTTDGTTPNRGSDPYSGPIQVSRTQTVKAIAYDAAGNASQVQSRTITIRTQSTTTLNVATADMKLGNTRAIGGGVSPNNSGGTVRLTIDRPGTLTTITRNLTLNEFSRYSTSYRPTAVGTYRIKAAFAKDADNLASTSETKSFRVVR